MMNDTPARADLRCAVVIPTYQRRDLIGRAITSVLDQELPPFEVIVVDDGSTDGTEEVVRSFPDVRYLRQPNRGVSAARNMGVDSTSAEWVAFLDSDDIWLPGHLRRIAEAMRLTEEGADLYFADANVGGDRTQTWFERCRFRPGAPVRLARDPLAWAVMPFQPMLVQASVIRRSAWTALGGLREDLCTREDTHLFFRLSMHGDVCAVNDVGIVVTHDSDPEVRLTEMHPTNGQVYYRASIVLYEDLVQMHDRLAPRYLEELRSRLSSAYWGLASTQARESRPIRVASSLRSAVAADPRAFTRRLARRLITARRAGSRT